MINKIKKIIKNWFKKQNLYDLINPKKQNLCDLINRPTLPFTDETEPESHEISSNFGTYGDLENNSRIFNEKIKITKKEIPRKNKNKKYYMITRVTYKNINSKIFFSTDFSNDVIRKKSTQQEKQMFANFSSKKKTEDKTFLFFKIEENSNKSDYSLLIENKLKKRYLSVSNEFLKLPVGKYEIVFLENNEFKITY
jgi:hypothetical protein